MFAVNVLAQDDIELAARFSARMTAAERFGAGEWLSKVTGAPVLASAYVSFDCRVIDFSDVGSHRIFFGAVAQVTLGREESAPLMYGLGAYGNFALPLGQTA